MTNQDQNPNNDRRVQEATAAFVAAVAALGLGLITAFAVILRGPGTLSAKRLRFARAANDARAQLAHDEPRLIEAVANAVTSTPPPLGESEQAWETLTMRAARILREDLQGRVNVMGLAITRAADDVYRAVASDAAMAEVQHLTPAQAQHQAYEAFLRRGITGFVDRAGHRWTLEAYVDMAVRTAVQRGFNEARVQAGQEAGFHDFIVSHDGAPCPLCQPWEGQVLSDGEPSPPAVASIATATSAGLFHPRCKHVLTPYVHDVTPPPQPRWSREDERRYRESQQQRRLERRIRALKRQVEGSLDPASKRAAQRRLARAQAAMRQFIDATGRVRIPRREQTHL